MQRYQMFAGKKLIKQPIIIEGLTKHNNSLLSLYWIFENTSRMEKKFVEQQL